MIHYLSVFIGIFIGVFVYFIYQKSKQLRLNKRDNNSRIVNWMQMSKEERNASSQEDYKKSTYRKKALLKKVRKEYQMLSKEK